jgi:hypothetical protein
MSQDRQATIWLGLGLIGLGIIFMLGLWIGWEKIWPIFILAGGVASVVGYAVSGFRESGLVFLGVGAILVGLFFFGFSLGYWDWSDMAWLWPVFPIIGGIAFVALFFADRGRDTGTLGVGCAAFMLGIAGLAVYLGLVGREIVRLWPLLLVFLGVVSLVAALLRLVRRG